MTFCTKTQHLAKNLFFCMNCAGNQKMDSSLYCEQCHPEYRTIHQHHAYDKKQISKDWFMNKYEDFKKELIRYIKMQFNKVFKNAAKTKEAFSQGVNNTHLDFKNALSDVKYNPKVQFQSYAYRKWLVVNKFWLNKPCDNAAIKKDAERFVKESLGEQNTSTIVNPWILEIKLKKPQQYGTSVDYEQEMGLLQQRVIELEREKDVGQLFARLTSYYTNEDIQQGLKEITNLEDEANHSHFLFHLARLKISELHTQGSQMMKEFLNDKNCSKSNKKQKQLFHYFKALSEWTVMSDRESENPQTIMFFQARNKMNYKLADPSKYLSQLTEAIKLDERPLYYACRAIGHMSMNNPEQAQKDFQEASKKHYKNDAMLNNRNYNNLNLIHKKQIDRSILRQSLSQHSTELILNFCRHFKKIKDYQQLKICCEQLINREPKNIDFRLRRFDTFFKQGDKDNAKEELSYIKNLDELDEDDIVECERKIELLKARENQQFGNYQDSIEKYKRVAEMGEQSATYWYNFAAFLFNYRDKLEQNQQAIKAINKAIELKPKPHYYQLKYLLLFISGNLQEAKTLHPHLDDPKFKPMQQHVIENS